MARRIELLIALALFAAPATAQETASAYDRAIAAGYKAAFLCSGLFNAGRDPAQIEAMELTGTYPEYQPILPTLNAEIDRNAKAVSVSFDPSLPPRIAAWRPNLGCAQLPIGVKADAVTNLPRLDLAAPDLDAQPWPMGDRNAMARAKGSRAALKSSVGLAFDGRTYGEGNRTTAVIIVQHGKIVEERYADGFGPHISQRTWSVAKSIAGTLIGVAASQGIVSPADPAKLLEWNSLGDPRAAITIGQLTRMASGLHGDGSGSRTDAVYFGGTAANESITALSFDTVPNTRFRYSNNDILLAIYALKQRLGDERMRAYPFTELFWKIGMTRTVPETDWRGNFILSSQVWTTARDLARFGLLYLNNGEWQGQRIFSADWRTEVSTPSGPQPSSALGYGLTFWLLNKSPGVPADTISANGNRGQFVVIVPAKDIVIVRRAEDPGVAFDIAKFTADILATLK